jgi:hypothetical protein
VVIDVRPETFKYLRHAGGGLCSRLMSDVGVLNAPVVRGRSSRRRWPPWPRHSEAHPVG